MALLLKKVDALQASAGSSSTRQSDSSAWARWERFCALAGVPPEQPEVRWLSQVELAGEVALFCQFLVWVCSAMRPNTHAHMLARPCSANAVVVAVR
jgi:hypothetical protein